MKELKKHTSPPIAILVFIGAMVAVSGLLSNHIGLYTSGLVIILVAFVIVLGKSLKELSEGSVKK